ncbi:MAG: flagellar biosynthesis protein FlgJ [Hydrogenophaga sp. SCN 70-13]|uniref:rod-binding protein n=2 Tax=unclassified Hydrogenophaga TaxID=2610897 RepID=UPI00086DB502|nr:rod-binding protein [Hydrogenophaga sp.]MBN9372867.1 rod-binding protein [Hydrogenophaga sp.]ODT32764.1 MAG: flagellar biosynthesis protein FlgJ [Hydrogenophaga sp. SCN 70-13]
MELRITQSLEPISDGAVQRARVEQAAIKFEAFFVGQMLKQMRQATQALAGEDSPFKDRIHQDMLDIADTQVADAMARQRAFGIADVILRQLLPPAMPVPLKSGADPVALSGQGAGASPADATGPTP